MQQDCCTPDDIELGSSMDLGMSPGATLEGSSLWITCRIRRVVPGLEARNRCAFGYEGPIMLSIPRTLFYIAAAQSPPSNSRQHRVLETENISHPCLCSSVSYPQSSQYLRILATSNTAGIEHTRDILVENVIFFNNIVEDLLAVIVDNQYFPLPHISLLRRFGFGVPCVALSDAFYDTNNDCNNILSFQHLDRGEKINALSRWSWIADMPILGEAA